MLSKALLRIGIVTLLVASVTQAQTLDQTLSGCNGAAPLQTIQAGPSDYRTKAANLMPGHRLLHDPGIYREGLPIYNKHGQPGQCIVIEGPANGSAVFKKSVDPNDDWNIVRLWNASYIALRNLTLDG